jgi:hypothetical protein
MKGMKENPSQKLYYCAAKQIFLKLFRMGGRFEPAGSMFEFAAYASTCFHILPACSETLINSSN